MGHDESMRTHGFSILGMMTAGCLLGWASGSAHGAPAPEVRAVWASSLAPALDSTEELEELAATVRSSGLNTMIIQVRRSGAVHYRSKLEPRASAVADRPGYDALAEALRIARDPALGRRIDVYAWFNVFPVHRPRNLPEDVDPPHIADAHPDWYSLDEQGKRLSFLDPAVPAVRDHFVALIEECLENYDVDGINLDYIRYPETGGGYHPVALERFRRLTGRSDRPKEKDPQWQAFRREQVTSLLRRIAVAVRRIRPDCLLTVDAVGFGRPPKESFADTAPYAQVYQDWAGWTEAGIVDVCCRMGYKREHVPAHAAQFRGWADFSVELQRRSGRLVTLGIGGFFNTEENTLVQYREARKRGLGTALFSYRRPIAEAEKTGEYGAASPFWKRLRSEIYPEDAPTPRPVWRRGRGTIAGRLAGADGARVRLEPGSLEQKTDVSGCFAFLDLAPGEYRVEFPGTERKAVAAVVRAGEVTLLGGP